MLGIAWGGGTGASGADGVPIVTLDEFYHRRDVAAPRAESVPKQCLITNLGNYSLNGGSGCLG